MFIFEIVLLYVLEADFSYDKDKKQKNSNIICILFSFFCLMPLFSLVIVIKCEFKENMIQ